MKNIILIFILLLFYNEALSQRVYKKPQFVKNWSNPSKHPDHIVLNFSEDPTTTISVTWRTSKDVKVGYGEIAIANESPAFIRDGSEFCEFKIFRAFFILACAISNS